MRIGNRVNMRITSARMARVAKSRVWSGKQRKSSGNIANTTTKGNQTLLSILNQINKGTSTTSGEKIAANQQKIYSYQVIGQAATRMEGHLNKFLATGENSMFGQTDATKAQEDAVDEISGFVGDYNVLIGKLTDSTESIDLTYAKNLKTLMTGNGSALKKIGITMNEKGKLSVDKKQLKTADLDDLNKLFGEEGSLSSKLNSIIKTVGTEANKQIETIKKELYTNSSNYSRYGTDTDSYGTKGSRYNAKG